MSAPHMCEDEAERGNLEARIRRQACLSIDFEFYRSRAFHQRRRAKQVWLKAMLRTLAQDARAATASVRRRAADRSTPLARCCLAAERRVCCA